MNKRIQELIEECGLYINPYNKEVTDKEIEYFAEMIVRECAAVSRESSKRIDDMGSLIAQDIEKHFGVEE